MMNSDLQSQIIHKEMLAFATQLLDLLWISVTTYDGISLAFYASPQSRVEEDRAAAVATSYERWAEAVCDRLDSSGFRYSFVSGSDQGFHFCLINEVLLAFALQDPFMVEPVHALLRQPDEPFLKLLAQIDDNGNLPLP